MNHQEGLSLELKDVGRRDAGTYVCTASNGIGKEAHAEIKVDITCKCRILHFLPFARNQLHLLLFVGGTTHATFDSHKFASIDRMGNNTKRSCHKLLVFFCHG